MKKIVFIFIFLISLVSCNQVHNDLNVYNGMTKNELLGNYKIKINDFHDLGELVLVRFESSIYVVKFDRKNKVEDYDVLKIKNNIKKNREEYSKSLDKIDFYEALSTFGLPEDITKFKDLLESLTSSYSTGQNTSNAFSDARNDMISIYGEEADIVKELQIICTGLKNNINIEQLLLDFAERCNLDDVMSFANVFEICNRQGGDLRKIVSDTRDIINDKIEIEMEIDTMLSGNKNELNIMMVMPVVIVLSLSSMGTMTIVSNTPINIVVKIVCLIIFGAAYFIGRKIVDIKI